MRWTETEKELNAPLVTAYGEHYAERLFLFMKEARSEAQPGDKVISTHADDCPWKKKKRCTCDVKFEIFHLPHGVN